MIAATARDTPPTLPRVAHWRRGRGPSGYTAWRVDIRTADGELLAVTAYARGRDGDTRGYELHVYRVGMQSERLMGPARVSTFGAVKTIADRLRDHGRRAIEQIQVEALRGVIA